MRMQTSDMAPLTVSSSLTGSNPPAGVTQKPLNNTNKFRNFLTNILVYARRQSKSVERNVHKLIQELINAQVEQEEFCYRLGRLLNSNPEPCIIEFLREDLPQLRQLLVTKELVIEGISPPPQIAFNTLPAPVSQPNVATSTIPIQKPLVAAGTTIAVLQNIPMHSNINIAKAGKTKTLDSKFRSTRPAAASSGLSTVHTSGKSSSGNGMNTWYRRALYMSGGC